MKILGFDSWLGGYRNFKRLEYFFDLNNDEFKLIHLSSWSGINYQEKKSKRMESQDISFYKTIDFDKILLIEKPDVVVFLSTEVLAHRAMIRSCRRLSIKTVHLFHGIISALSIDKESSYQKTNIQKLIFGLTRIPKYFKFILPCYFLSLYKDKAGFIEYLETFKMIIRFFQSKNIFNERDSRTENVIVYNKLDLEYIKKKYKKKYNVSSIVGSPDLSDFNFEEKHINTFKNEENNRFVIYLDSVPFLRGLCSYDENLHYLKEIIKVLKKQKLTLAIKLHPEHQKTSFSHYLKNEGAVLLDKENFIEHIKKSKFVISEATSLMLIPALVGLPILLSKANIFQNMNYGKLLSSYPRTIIFSKLTDLENIDLRPRISIEKWIEKNKGPLPFSKFSERVYKLIKNI